MVFLVNLKTNNVFFVHIIFCGMFVCIICCLLAYFWHYGEEKKIAEKLFYRNSVIFDLNNIIVN